MVHRVTCNELFRILFISVVIKYPTYIIANMCAYASMLANVAFCSMNSRRGATSSPMSMEKT